MVRIAVRIDTHGELVWLRHPCATVEPRLGKMPDGQGTPSQESLLRCPNDEIDHQL
jgi:hypothetical protein